MLLLDKIRSFPLPKTKQAAKVSVEAPRNLPGAVSVQVAVAGMPWLSCGSNSGHRSLTVLEAGKPEVSVSAVSASGEGSLPGFQMTVCVLSCQRRGGGEKSEVSSGH